MFCGSCMHDNTLARALVAQGAEVNLIPTYTPIRVDEQDLSTREIFFGGVNVYLDYRWSLWRKLPPRLTRWFDAPWILNLATKFVSSNARQLGNITLAMLEGESGPQRREVEVLVDFLAGLKPDVICFSNVLLVGALREFEIAIRRENLLHLARRRRLPRRSAATLSHAGAPRNSRPGTGFRRFSSAQPVLS